MLVKKLIITGLPDSFPENATAKVSIIFLPTTILHPHFFKKSENSLFCMGKGRAFLLLIAKCRNFAVVFVGL